MARSIRTMSWWEVGEPSCAVPGVKRAFAKKTMRKVICRVWADAAHTCWANGSAQELSCHGWTIGSNSAGVWPGATRHSSPSRVEAQLLGLQAVDGRSLPKMRGRIPSRSVKLATVAMVACTLALILWIDRLPSRRIADSSGNGPQVLVNDKLFQVGNRPGVAVVLEPMCESQPTIVLLDDRGNIWSFATAENETEGVREAEVGGATQLEVSTRNDCAAVSAKGLAGEVQLQMFDP